MAQTPGPFLNEPALKEVHVTVVVEQYMPYKTTHSYQKKFAHICHTILLNNHIIAGMVVFPTWSKTAAVTGISAIKISKSVLNLKESFEACMVDHNTVFKIDRVQSHSHFILSSDKEQICVGGLNREFDQLKVLMEFNMNLSLYQCHKTVGVLLHGPTGCGKTSLCKAVAQSCKAAFLNVESTEITKSEYGASAEALRVMFKKAVTLSREGPTILFLDELDKLCPSSSSASLGSHQLTNALVTALDELCGARFSNLLVVAATNAIFNVNPALRRPGRFEREILLNVPSQQQRQAILEVQKQAMELVLAVDVSESDIAMMTPGFVGADLRTLCEEALNQAFIRQTHKQSQHPQYTAKPILLKEDFMAALHRVTPSLKKGLSCYVDLQGVQWDEIGGLDDIKAEIQQAIEWPLLHPQALSRMDLQPTKGVLLHGPPGCCKTTLVRAAASSSHVTFLSLNGAQVYSPYVGESERIIAEAFQKARSLSPSILFFDEIESLVGKRGSGGGQSRVQERILATMLNEMDGIGTRLDHKTDASRQQTNVPEKELVSEAKDKGSNGQAFCVESAKHYQSHEDSRLSEVDKSRVIVIGATNRPDMLDPAILRPGRLDRHIYVPPPDREGRQSILKLVLSKMPTSNDVDVDYICAHTENFSGADIKHLCREAAFSAIRMSKGFEDTLVVGHKDFIRGMY